jgi:hypothetical protein
VVSSGLADRPVPAAPAAAHAAAPDDDIEAQHAYISDSVSIGSSDRLAPLYVDGQSAFGNNVQPNLPYIAMQLDQRVAGSDTFRGLRSYLTQTTPNPNPVIAIDGACYDTASTGSVQSCRGGDFSTFLTTGQSSSITHAVGVSTNIASDGGTGDIAVGEAVLGDFRNYAFTQQAGMATIARAFGIRAGVALSGTHASVGTGYGVYIDRVDAAQSYGLYQSDPASANVFAGPVGLGVTSPGLPLQAASGAGLTADGTWLDAADAAQRVNVSDLDYGLAQVLDLRPRRFSVAGQTGTRVGLTGEEVASVIPEAVYGPAGHEAISTSALIAVLVRAVQEQQGEIACLSGEMLALQETHQSAGQSTAGSSGGCGPFPTPHVVAVPSVSRVPGGAGAVTASFTVSFPSGAPGNGEVYFGSGPGCRGLVQVATHDLHPGTTEHAVVVTGNDLPGTVGSNGLQPGATYWFEPVTVTRSGTEIDDNGGNCYSVTLLRP